MQRLPMPCMLLALILSVQGMLAQSEPGNLSGLVVLDNTEFDPFTDEAELVLHGVGKNNKISLTVDCGIDPTQYSLVFRFQSELEGWVPLSGGEENKWKWGNGYGELRFDDGPIEEFGFFSAMTGSIVVGRKYEDGKVTRNSEADSLVERFPNHNRLRIRIEAIWIGRGDPDSIIQTVVEDFDISFARFEELEFLTKRECTLRRADLTSESIH